MQALRRLSLVQLTLCSDLLALVLFALAQVLVQSAADEAFLAQPLPASLILLSALLFIFAGIAAISSLLKEPLLAKRGVWATRLTWLFVWLLIAGTSLAIGIHASGHEISEEVGQWLEAVTLGLACSAAFLGVVSDEPDYRGWLVVPVVLAAFTVSFVAGAILIQN